MPVSMVDREIAVEQAQARRRARRELEYGALDAVPEDERVPVPLEELAQERLEQLRRRGEVRVLDQVPVGIGLDRRPGTGRFSRLVLIGVDSGAHPLRVA